MQWISRQWFLQVAGDPFLNGILFENSRKKTKQLIEDLGLKIIYLNILKLSFLFAAITKANMNNLNWTELEKIVFICRLNMGARDGLAAW